MDVQTYNKVFLPQWTTASLFIRNLQLTLEGKCDKESLRQLQIIGWNEETKKFISDVLNLYKEKVVNELNSCSNYEHGKHKNCPICGKQSFSTSNRIFVYDEQPTTKNTKAGDIVLYKKEVWINDGNIVINLDDYIDKDGTILKPLTKDQTAEETLKENTMENYIVINGKKEELTEEQLNYLCMFNRFAQMAKEQFGLTITQKETAGETFKTLFGVDFSDCSERNNPFNSELKSGDNYFIVDEGVKTS